MSGRRTGTRLFDRNGVLVMWLAGTLIGLMCIGQAGRPEPSAPTLPEWLGGITEYQGPGAVAVSVDGAGRLLLSFEELGGLEPLSVVLLEPSRRLLRRAGTVSRGDVWLVYDYARDRMELEVIEAVSGEELRVVLAYDPALPERVRAIGSWCDCPPSCDGDQERRYCLVGEAAVCYCDEEQCVQVCRQQAPGGAVPDDPP